MSIPQDLRYAKSHEWVRSDDGTAVIGITDYAQDQLGEVVYIELPEVGNSVDAGEELGTLESVKAVSEFLAPISGEVIEVNEELVDEPGLVNDDPYGQGWLVKISTSAVEDLLSAEEYEQLIEEESH